MKTTATQAAPETLEQVLFLLATWSSRWQLSSISINLIQFNTPTQFSSGKGLEGNRRTIRASQTNLKFSVIILALP